MNAWELQQCRLITDSSTPTTGTIADDQTEMSGTLRSSNVTAMSDWKPILQQRLHRHTIKQRYRTANTYTAIDAVTLMTSAGRHCINFASNDYLGLAHDPRLRSTASAIKQTGSGSARLVSGQHPAHEQVETDLAAFFEREAAITFSSGYVANLTILQALAQRNDAIIMDKHNHASLIDGGRLSDATLLRYNHQGIEHAERLLLQSSGSLKLLVSDGVFSMQGDCADIAALVHVAKTTNAMLLIDDAHGIGVLGKHGRGLAASTTGVDLLIGTFGKALGSAGAFAVGDQLTIDYLRNFARGFIYSTAVPPLLATTQSQALAIVSGEPEHQQQLLANIDYFKQCAIQLSLNLLPSDTAIQSVMLNDNSVTTAVQNALLSEGFLIGAMRPPTVPEGTARLRITLSAKHRFNQIDALIDTLKTHNPE